MQTASGGREKTFLGLYGLVILEGRALFLHIFMKE
jgi:hypothetical protein